MRLSEMIYTEEEMQELREEIKKLKIDIGGIMGERDGKQMRIEELNERIRFLEQCLDNKEKVNKQLRKDIKWYEKEEDRLREENKKLKEELEKWEKDYKEGIIVHCRNG